MKETLDWAQQHAVQWIADYGYGAVVPALLLDPGGVPWPWIFLMLLAKEAGKSVVLMIWLGFALLTAFDHALYGIGRFGAPLLRRIETRWPKTSAVLQKSEEAVRQHGFWAITAGRFLPFLGRWVGLGAGLANVSWPRFAFFNALGVGLTVIGFGIVANIVGQKTLNAPWFPQALFVVFVGGTIFTLGGAAIAAWRSRRKNTKAETV